MGERGNILVNNSNNIILNTMAKQLILKKIDGGELIIPDLSLSNAKGMVLRDDLESILQQENAIALKKSKRTRKEIFGKKEEDNRTLEELNKDLTILNKKISSKGESKKLGEELLILESKIEAKQVQKNKADIIKSMDEKIQKETDETAKKELEELKNQEIKKRDEKIIELLSHSVSELRFQKNLDYLMADSEEFLQIEKLCKRRKIEAITEAFDFFSEKYNFDKTLINNIDVFELKTFYRELLEANLKPDFLEPTQS